MTIYLWRALFGAIIGIATFAIFARFAHRRAAVHGRIAQMQGVMTVSRVYVAGSVIIMGGGGLFLLGPWIISTSALPGYLGIVCIALAGISLTGLLPIYRVTWDQAGITAPATFCGMPRPGPKRVFTWDGITAAGGDLLGNHMLVDRTGQKLRWNFSYRGHHALLGAIAAYRPDLFR